jgi:ubiquinone/menaquinone biosynthesis C-methylase UbiE
MERSTPAEAFSSVAAVYDRDFGDLHGVPALRQRVLRCVQKHVPPGSTILEIGAGTGEDARLLLATGYRPTATDIAPEMVSIAQTKLKGAGVPTYQVAAEDIGRTFPDGSFDAVFSNFGALNCVEDLPELLPRLGEVVKPGGIMILCLLGKFSFWEMASSLARLRLRAAFRRIAGGPVEAAVGIYRIPVRYYSVSAIRKTCSQKFRIVEVAGLNVVSPPPGSTGFARTFPRTTRLLNRLDHQVSRIPGLAGLGDHVILVLRRVNSSSPRRQGDNGSHHRSNRASHANDH